MTSFTPLWGLIGGALIGLSVALGFVWFGRVVGISGLFASLPSRRAFPALFVLGLVTGPLWVMPFTGMLHGFQAPPIWAILVGGVLVGVGTRLGSGCTSGHGVAGLARLSPRSLVATLTFMALGFVTVGVVRGAFL